MSSLLLLTVIAEAISQDLPPDKPSEIDKLGIFIPLSHIEVISKGNQPEFSDSLSLVSQLLVLDVYRQNAKKYPFGDELKTDDSLLQENIDRQVLLLLQKLDKSKANRISSIEVSNLIVKRIQESGQRFGLI